MTPEAPLCACGCGRPVNRKVSLPKLWNKYLAGHANKHTVASRKKPERIHQKTAGVKKAPKQYALCQVGGCSVAGERRT